MYENIHKFNLSKRMSVVKRTFSLPDDVSEMLDKSIPNQERSKFIALLISDALKKKKINALVDAIDNIDAQEVKNISIVDVIRGIRQTHAN